jgi:hypothetical protein
MLMNLAPPNNVHDLSAVLWVRSLAWCDWVFAQGVTRLKSVCQLLWVFVWRLWGRHHVHLILLVGRVQFFVTGWLRAEILFHAGYRQRLLVAPKGCQCPCHMVSFIYKPEGTSHPAMLHILTSSNPAKKITFKGLTWSGQVRWDSSLFFVQLCHIMWPNHGSKTYHVHSPGIIQEDIPRRGIRVLKFYLPSLELDTKFQSGL